MHVRPRKRQDAEFERSEYFLDPETFQYGPRTPLRSAQVRKLFFQAY